MTTGCEVWVADLLARKRAIKGDVLEVGSLDVNGSIRRLFADRHRFPSYLGIDMRGGPGVDLEATGDNLPFDDGRFAIVVALEMLEHDRRFWLTLAECHRVLRPGGHLIVTTRAFGFPRHEHPHDYWRFTTEGLVAALEWAGFELADAIEDHDDLGIFGFARRLDDMIDRPTRREPGPAVLLVEEEVEVLRTRMRSLIPLGITSMADAFERVDSDRRLLLGLMEDVLRESGLSLECRTKLLRVMGNGEVERERAREMQGLPE